MNTTPRTVLIVDDEADLREALKTALEYEAFSVLTARDGEEGLKSALQNKPDVVLLDIGLPKMDGITVLKRIRESERGKDVKVIVMTALDDFEKIAQVLEFGGSDYVVKSHTTLNAIIEKVKSKLA